MVIQYNTNLRFLLILHIYHFEKLYKLTAPVTINNYAMNVAIQKVYPCHQADSPMTNIFMVSGKTRHFSLLINIEHLLHFGIKVRVTPFQSSYEYPKSFGF